MNTNITLVRVELNLDPLKKVSGFKPCIWKKKVIEWRDFIKSGQLDSLTEISHGLNQRIFTPISSLQKSTKYGSGPYIY